MPHRVLRLVVNFLDSKYFPISFIAKVCVQDAYSGLRRALSRLCLSAGLVEWLDPALKTDHPLAYGHTTRLHSPDCLVRCGHVAKF